jgi:uncharacterized protein (DUF1499 family)
VSLLSRLSAYPINEVSTDLDSPPPLDGRDGTPAGGPPMTDRRREKVRRAYPDLVGGLTLPLDVDQAFTRVQAVARQQPGWVLGRTDAAERMLTVVAVTRLVHFKDDVTVRVRQAGGGARIDVRSRSRVGRDDLGANATRIRRFFRDLQAAGAASR